MRMRMGILTTLACVAVGLLIWSGDLIPPAQAGSEVISAATAMAVLPAGDDDIAYVGSNKCKACHKEQFKSWEETVKGKAFETLQPGQAIEAKKAANLDPEKDYTTDEGCLKCHTTGYGHKDGYAIPDPADEKAVKEAAKLANVGCECCHGPGEKYVELHKEIKKGKGERKYKDEEMYAAGVWKIEEARCKECHNDKSPTFKKLDFEKQKDEVSHVHVPLEYREE
ncbi:MAG: cytochrome c family protein [Planctomycetes bacterium]|nr:cytochrome c family protein [Planctomycetota bacterium]